MRKGADCLSKWVGEAERQLRLLFEQAKRMQPSIIFFDEIDGLAPVRSAKQDQIHASIVSTLLALMDGMDSRGQIVVIGATNRLDSIDPALRRPGRFDRELAFALPTREARASILKIHTRSWPTVPSREFLLGLASRTQASVTLPHPAELQQPPILTVSSSSGSRRGRRATAGPTFVHSASSPRSTPCDAATRRSTTATRSC